MSKQHLQPIRDRVVVRPLKEEEKTESGIIIPESAEKERKRGIVLAVGPGLVASETGERIPPEVVPGDTILYDEVSSDPYTIGGEEIEILLHDAIIGVVHDEDRKSVTLSIRADPSLSTEEAADLLEQAIKSVRRYPEDFIQLSQTCGIWTFTVTELDKEEPATSGPQ